MGGGVKVLVGVVDWGVSVGVRAIVGVAVNTAVGSGVEVGGSVAAGVSVGVTVDAAQCPEPVHAAPKTGLQFGAQLPKTGRPHDVIGEVH